MGGEGDLDRAFGQVAGDACLAALFCPDEQTRVVPANGVGADEDGVAARTDVVDAVEVLIVGQQEPLGVVSSM